MRWLYFSDAVPPEHQSCPAYVWFPRDQKTAIKSTSGRNLLNIQGAINPEAFQFTFVGAEKIMPGQRSSCWKSQSATTRTWRPFTSIPTMPVIITPEHYRHGWKVQAMGEVAFSACLCATSKSDRASLGHCAQMGGPQSILRRIQSAHRGCFEVFPKNHAENRSEFRETVTDNFRSFLGTITE